MKIAIAGISLECDAFSPILTGFESIAVYRYNELIEKGLWLIRGMLRRLRESPEIEVCPLIWATGLPAGPLVNQVYKNIRSETLRLLRENGPFDGILLAMHGSLVVDNLGAHGDTDYIQAVREAVGPDVPIGIAFDLHGNITPEIAKSGDVFSALRTAPHKDDPETGYRVADQLVNVIEKKLKPKTAYIKIPFLLHGEQAVTNYEPGKHLYEGLFEYDNREGVMQSVLMSGYVWHDMQWTGMAAMVTTEKDQNMAKELAEELAQNVWNARHDFKFMMETADIRDGILRAVKSNIHPVYLTDSGDNVTSGSPGDLTIVLQDLIKAKVKDAVVAGITSPQIVHKCRSAGKGAFVKINLGREHTLFKDQTMGVTARVEQVGDSFTQFGPYPVNEGPWTRVRINDIIVTFHERRIGIVANAHFEALGIDPEKHSIYVLKQGYLFPEFESIAKRSILIFSPGATEYDLFNLNYKNVGRPVFPLDPEMFWEAKGKSVQEK